MVFGKVSHLQAKILANNQHTFQNYSIKFYNKKILLTRIAKLIYFNILNITHLGLFVLISWAVTQISTEK